MSEFDPKVEPENPNAEDGGDDDDNGPAPVSEHMVYSICLYHWIIMHCISFVLNFLGGRVYRDLRSRCSVDRCGGEDHGGG